MAVLLVLLVAREVERLEPDPTEERVRRTAHLSVAIAPLTLVFIGVVASRLLELLK